MKFSKEIRIALVAIISLAILFYGINFLKGINLFKNSNTYTVKFENVCGLTVSSPVFADGYNVGIVRSIEYDKDKPGNLSVSIDVDKELRIPEGSTAELEASMLGSVSLNLLLANNPRHRIEPGGTIIGRMKVGALDMAAEMVPQVQAMMPKLDSILTSVNRLLSDPALSATLQNTQQTTANLATATAQLNTMMASLNQQMPKITSHVNNIGENLETTTSNLAKMDLEGISDKANTTLEKMGQLTDRLTSKDNTIGLMLNDPTLYNNLTITTNNASSLMRDLQEHPSRYVHFSLFGKKDKNREPSIKMEETSVTK